LYWQEVQAFFWCNYKRNLMSYFYLIITQLTTRKCPNTMCNTSKLRRKMLVFLPHVLRFLAKHINEHQSTAKLIFKEKKIYIYIIRTWTSSIGSIIRSVFHTPYSTVLSLLCPWWRCSNMWQYLHFSHPTVQCWNCKLKIIFAMLLTTTAKTIRHCLCNYAQNHNDVWWSGDKALPILKLNHFMEVNGHFHTPAAWKAEMFGIYWKFEKETWIFLTKVTFKLSHEI
jgi:hypothetical protein